MITVEKIMELIKLSEDPCVLIVDNYDRKGHFMAIPITQFDQFKETIGSYEVKSISADDNKIIVTVNY